jgi:hypothetical protein
MKNLQRTIRPLAFIALLLVGLANAQATLGLTYNPVTPNGDGFGVQLTLPVHVWESEDRNPLQLALRASVVTGVMFDLPPTTDLSVSFRWIDGDRNDGQREWVPYVGTGVGIWHYRIFDVPCYDITWSLHAGVDVPLTRDLYVRGDLQVAPLISQWILGIGVAYAFGD